MQEISLDYDVLLKEIEQTDNITEEDILIKNVIICMLENRIYDIDFDKINSRILFKIKRVIETAENPLIRNIINFGYMTDFVTAIKSFYKVGEDEVW